MVAHSFILFIAIGYVVSGANLFDNKTCTEPDDVHLLQLHEDASKIVPPNAGNACWDCCMASYYMGVTEANVANKHCLKHACTKLPSGDQEGCVQDMFEDRKSGGYCCTGCRTCALASKPCGKQADDYGLSKCGNQCAWAFPDGEKHECSFPR